MDAVSVCGSLTPVRIAAATSIGRAMRIRPLAGPNDATSTAASGGPMIVATTYPFESTAFTRSQRWCGTMIGNSERRPVWLNELVSEATAEIATSNQGGSAPASDRMPMRNIDAADAT